MNVLAKLLPRRMMVLASIAMAVVLCGFSAPAGAVDLIVNDFAIVGTTSSVDPGANVSFTYKITNTGANTVRPFYFAIYFSESPNLETTQDFNNTTRLWQSPAIWGAGDGQTFTHGTVINGSSFSAVGNIPTTAEPKDYYIYLFADNQKKVGETDESNNIKKFKITILKADLAVQEFKLDYPVTGDPEIAPDQETGFHWRVKNLGARTHARFGATIYMSNQDGLETTRDFSQATAIWRSHRLYSWYQYYYDCMDPINRDNTISHGSQSGFGGIYCYASSGKIPKGTAPGTYYLYFWIDSNRKIPEDNETNNVMKMKIIVKEADLVATAFSMQGFTGQPVVDPGQPVSFDYTFKNQGARTKISFAVTIYLSRSDSRKTNGDFSTDTVIWTKYPYASLADKNQEFTQVAAAANGKIPTGTAPGTWYMYIAVDYHRDSRYTKRVPEPDEQNNIFMFPITVRKADLVVNSFSIKTIPTPVKVNPGQTISLEYIIKNTGARTHTDFAVAVYLHQQSFTKAPYDFTGGYTLYQKYPYASYADKNQEFKDTDTGRAINVRIPTNAGAGDWYIYIAVDYHNDGRYTQRIPETDEDNNVKSIKLTVEQPDLQATKFVRTGGLPNESNPNTAVSYLYEFKNVGARVYSNFYASIYFSYASNLETTQDFSGPGTFRLWTSPRFSGANTGQVFGQNTQANFTIPNVAGTWYLYFAVDFHSDNRYTQQIAESDETNNIMKLKFTIQGRDLVATSLTSSATEVYPGQRLDVTGTFRNVGASVSSARFYNYLYISRNETYTPGTGNSSLGNIHYYNRSLGPAQVFTDPFRFNLPNWGPGDAYLHYEVNGNTTYFFTEISTANNVVSLKLKIRGSDMTVTEIKPTFPATLLTSTPEVHPNSAMTFSWIYKNQGSAPALSSRGFRNHLYYSRDATWDPNDGAIGNTAYHQNSATYAIGGQTTRTNTFNSPITPGVWYVIAVTNYNYATSNQNEFTYYRVWNEEDTTNNAKAFKLEVLAPDLTIEDLTVPAEAQPTQWVDISFKIKNQGKGNVSRTVYFRGYASGQALTVTQRNATRMACRYNGNTDHRTWYVSAGNLKAGQSVEIKGFQCQIPNWSRRKAQVGIAVDTGQVISTSATYAENPESDEDNNYASSEVFIGPRIDFTVDGLETDPKNPVQGSPAFIKLGVKNIGDIDFRDTQYVNIRLYIDYERTPNSGSYSRESTRDYQRLDGAIEVGKTKQMLFNWTPLRAARYKIYVLIDHDNRYNGNPDPRYRGGELNDSNNSMTIFVNVGADNDGDGYTTPADCNDNNKAINPGAKELCDGIDQNCDGQIDENVQNCCRTGDKRDCYSGTAGCSQQTDGSYICKGLCKAGQQSCSIGRWSQCVGAVVAGNEICDGKDNDCDGEIDEGFDKDGDGYTTCGGGDPSLADCDDSNKEIYPGTNEKCDGKDNNCDGKIDEGFDKDNDGYTTCGGGDPTQVDCDDNNDKIYPTAIELCDGKDNNCDGQTDEAANLEKAPDCDKTQGVCAGSKKECGGASGWKACTDATYKKQNADYDPVDGKDNKNCDSKDNNCDGRVDEDCACEAGQIEACYSGSKGCQFDASSGTFDCKSPCKSGERTCSATSEWGPCVGEVVAGKEICDNKDNDCDGQVDNPDSTDLCPSGDTCNNGKCVSCYKDGCSDGKICKEGKCIDDPCDGVSCENGEFCRNGKCVPTCGDRKDKDGNDFCCKAGEKCEDGQCANDPCADKKCDDGKVCVDGNCVEDPCKDVTCTDKRYCNKKGECVDDPCAWVSCPGDLKCVKGQCEPEDGVATCKAPEEPAPAEKTNDGGPEVINKESNGAIEQGTDIIVPPPNSGCGCDASGGSTAPFFVLFLLLAFPIIRRRFAMMQVRVREQDRR